MRRAPVKEPAQRAPERSAPDASGAGGLRHEKAARPVWIGLARAGRTWHPATARIDRTHARVGRPRERDRLPPAGARRIGCNHPRPTARRRSDLSRMGSGSVPTLFSGGARKLRSLRVAPFQIRRLAAPKGAERTDRNGESSRGWPANPSRRTGRNGVSRFRLCHRRRTTTGREPDRGPRI